MSRGLRTVGSGLIALLLGLSALAIGCSGGEPAAENTPSAGASPTTAPASPAETPEPTQQSQTEGEATSTPSDGATPTPSGSDSEAPPTPTPIQVEPSQEAPQSQNPTGNLVWAVQEVAQTWGGFNSVNIGPPNTAMGITEDLFKPTHENIATPMLAEDWTLDDDLNGATVKLRENIPFHFGYGELTAEDVAWSYNDANPGYNPESVTDGGGDWAGFLGDNVQEAVDRYTVKLNWAAFDPRWQVWYFGQDGLSAQVLSKQAFEQEGREWNLDHVVGTGAFMLTEWVRGDHYSYERVMDHWRKTPEVETIRQQAVPDQTVRIAMIQSGEADIIDVGLREIPDLLERGFVTEGSGTARQASIWFSGNLWEAEHIRTGEPLEIVTYNNDIPWLGNPHDPDDVNNPEGIDDMEQARLVRVALSHAIDRELVNDAVQSGLGWPVYIPYFDPTNEHWQDKWVREYDPDLAEQLLDQAGFPRQGEWRFDMPLFAWPVGHDYAGIGDAVAGLWRDIGVNTTVLHYEYPVFRPSLVARSNTTPWTDTGPLDAYSGTPWDWPRGVQCSSLTRGGKSHGVETRQCGEFYLQVAAEPDLQQRIAMNNQFADFMYESAIGVGTVAIPSLIVYNPNSIADWPMERGVRQIYNTPENIILP